MAPPRGDRGGKEGSWVKKGGDKVAQDDAVGDDDDKPSRRRQPREARPRRELRDGRDCDDDNAGKDGKDGGKEGKGRGRGKGRGGRRGTQDHHNHDDREDEGQPPKVTRYTKMELLAISQSPASKAKPVDLSPLIDKENKESELLVRIANARFGNAGEEDDGAAIARRERRERRRRVEDEEEDDERRRRIEDGDSSQAQPHNAKPSAPEKQMSNATSAGPEETEESRAASKWSKADLDKGSQASSATASAASTTVGTSAAAAALSQGYQSSLLSQQAQSSLGGANLHAQAQAMQAAMAMSMAAAAGRGGPYAGLNPYAGYNPYLFPYNASGAYGGYPNTLDYSLSSQTSSPSLLEAQAKLAAQAQAAANMYGFSGDVAPAAFSQTTRKTPSTTASTVSKTAASSLLSTGSTTSPSPSPLEASVLGSSMPARTANADSGMIPPESGDGGTAKGEGEEEEGCTQS